VPASWVKLIDDRMGDDLKELIQRVKRLSPSEVENAQAFIDGWNRFKVRFPQGFPEDKLWVNIVANHPDWARLLGVTVNSRHHWPFVQLRCPSPCPLCNRPERDEQRIREAVEREEEERARAQKEQALREVQDLQRRERLTEAQGACLSSGGRPWRLRSTSGRRKRRGSLRRTRISRRRWRRTPGWESCSSIPGSSLQIGRAT
jgi:hypothetical protein